MTKQIDITPTTHLVASMRNQDMPQWLALCELVDNSLDAGAEKVCIQVDEKQRTLTVKDDGKGAPDPTAIVRIGDHKKVDQEGSGRYGIGAKDAICTLGTCVKVTTTRNGLKTSIYADFDQIEQTNKWVAQMVQTKADHEKSGTSIEISNLKRLPNQRLVQDKISKIFAPALRGVVEITINKNKVFAYKQRLVNDVIEGCGEFNGKEYRWWAGMIPTGHANEAGWHFEFHHRRLESTTCNRAYGTNGMDIHRFHGVITLIEPKNAGPEKKWRVNKHKTSSEELQDLCEHIFPEIRELLEKAESEYALTLEAEIADEVGRGLTDALKKLEVMREKRTLPTEDEIRSLLAEPAYTGRRRVNASKVQPGQGSVLAAKNFNGKKFNIRFLDESRFGYVTGDRKANVVYFGKDHPYWKTNIHDKNAIYLAAMAMLAGHAVTTEGENQPIMSAVVPSDAANDRFFQTFGKIAAQVAGMESTEEGSPLCDSAF